MSVPLAMIKRLQALESDFSAAPDLLIRRYGGPADREAWLQIHRVCFASGGPGWNRSVFHREFLRGGRLAVEGMWFAALAGEAPIGTVTWTPSLREPNVVHIRWLAVMPQSRRQGVASRLLQVAEQEAVTRGFDQARLETLPDWEAAVAFYRARGYRAAGRWG